MTAKSNKKKPSAPSLNTEQKLVADHAYGPLFVSALAGTGKTSALVERVATLVNKHGIRPERILVLSFSQAAAKEVGKRLNERLPHVDTDRLFRTFHSLALEIHRSSGDPDVLLDSSGAFTRQAFFGVARQIDGNVDWDTFKSFSSAVKNDFIGTHPLLAALGKKDDKLAEMAASVVGSGNSTGALLDAYKLYEKYRKSGMELALPGQPPKMVKWVNFDELLYDVCWLLSDSTIRGRWKGVWDFVMQDEAQDVCESQNVLAEYLCETHRNYMAVGDPYQTIFGFRGASPDRLLNFKKRWDNAKVIPLEQNYRSGKNILDVANRVLERCQEGHERQTRLSACRGEPGYVGYHEFGTFSDQANAIAKNIIKHVEGGVLHFSDMAILVRTADQAAHVDVALSIHNIPIKSPKPIYFDAFEVSAALAWYRVVLGGGSADDISTALLNPASGKIGQQFVDLILADKRPGEGWLDVVARNHDKTKVHGAGGRWYNAIKRLTLDAHKTPAQLMSSIGGGGGPLSKLFEKKGAESDASPVMNWRRLMDFLSEYRDHAEAIAVIEKVKQNREKSKRQTNVVTVSTIHAAKGREWPIVFLPGVANGLFPHANAEKTEERRLFYVAVTRARDELWISRAIEDLYGSSNPSDFVTECGLKPMERYELGVQRRDGSQGLLI